MRVWKCHATCIWTLLLAVLLAGVPRYSEIAGRAEAAAVPAPLPPPFEFLEGIFEPNATLSTTLEENDVSARVAYDVAQAIRPIFNVRGFQPEHPYRIVKEPDGSLAAFEYTIDDESVLKVERGDDGFVARVHQLPLVTEITTVTATVNRSLWAALTDMNFPKADSLVMGLVDIYDAQVDFFRDIRSGDAIRLIIEAKYHRGEFVKYGDLLAAEFVNQGHPLQAFRFRDDYYDENGMSTRRSFLRAPLQFTRLSSGYTTARLHPIYNTVRPHLGVDYAAPTGTDVWAASDGTVTFAGTNGGFGRMVTIRHPNGVTTSYAHLSRILVNVGARVKQREPIGRVGMTGTATGPHLDYRMTVSGRSVNPGTQRLDPPKPIDPSLKDAYLASVVDLSAELRSLAMMSGN